MIANTGDDIEIYGAYVSPDPDLVSFWLADRIDERGWGIDGDTFAAMEVLRELGVEVWFNLGDRDLACASSAARCSTRADAERGPGALNARSACAPGDPDERRPRPHDDRGRRRAAARCRSS